MKQVPDTVTEILNFHLSISHTKTNSVQTSTFLRGKYNKISFENVRIPKSSVQLGLLIRTACNKTYRVKPYTSKNVFLCRNGPTLYKCSATIEEISRGTEVSWHKLLT